MNHFTLICLYSITLLGEISKVILSPRIIGYGGSNFLWVHCITFHAFQLRFYSIQEI